ncbi:MAG: lipid II flippase MurJ, partial [Rubritalea sp.]|uniref:murein biosynthesis integral membrane protein MurJ n=1 Tax=Rubritalea sp. TaxID=2109375 RepID=UPI0032422504
MITHLKTQFSRWNTWQGLSTNRRIFSAMLVVGMMTGFAKLAMVARELVIASFFGTGSEVDALLIAFMLPMFAVSVLAGSFSSAVMPTYIQIKSSKGEEAAKQLFSSLLALAIPFLIIVTFVLALSAPLMLPIIGSGFSFETQALTLSLFYWLLPVFALSGINRLFATVINAGEQFAAVALMPGITPICAVISLLVFFDTWGIHALVLGTAVGAFVEVLVLAKVADQSGIPLLPRWDGMTDDLRKVVNQYSPMVAGAFLMSSTVVVDQAMAAMLEPGSVATLNYGSNMVLFPLSLASLALGTVVFPHFSRMVSLDDFDGIRNTLKIYSRLILLITVPGSLLLFYFSEQLVVLVFQRGAFTEKNTHIVAVVQSYYSLQMPFFLTSSLMVRLISSFKKNHFLMRGAV